MIEIYLHLSHVVTQIHITLHGGVRVKCAAYFATSNVRLRAFSDPALHSKISGASFTRNRNK
jgi:hypothetical protein